MTATRRQQNQKKHWDDRQAAASTPEEKAAVWYDACRMLARRLEPVDPAVWTELAEDLRRFFDRYMK